MKDFWYRFEKWALSVFQFDSEKREEPSQSFVQTAPPPIQEEDIDPPLEEPSTLETPEIKKEAIPKEEEEPMGNIEPIRPHNPVRQNYRETEKPAEQKDEEIATAHIETDRRFEKMLSLTAETIKYYDQMAAMVDNPDVALVLDDFSKKMIENMILAGCTPINGEEGVFDMTRHRVVPFQMIADGTPYRKLVREGAEWNGQAKVLAIVEL